MTAGDKFTWLHSENDHRFGEECEVIGVRGDKLDFRYVNRPTWKTATMPVEWAKAKKDYSTEEISAIRKLKKWRVAGIF